MSTQISNTRQTNKIINFLQFNENKKIKKNYDQSTVYTVRKISGLKLTEMPFPCFREY